jgi:uncharacterized protein (TIRG00374 family)
MASRAALGIALLAYVLRSGGAWESLQQLFGLIWLVALLNLVPLLGAAVEARRLGVLFGAYGVQLPFALAYRTIAVATLFNMWVPGGTGGDVMKFFYFARRNRGRGVEVATIVLVDRTVALFSLLLLISILLVAQRETTELAPVITRLAGGTGLGLGLLLVATVAVWSPSIRESRAYGFVVRRLPLGGHLARAADAAYAFRTRRRALAVAVLLSLGGHLMLAATLALTGSFLVPGVSPLLVSTLSLLGLIANVIPITPGGVGVGEAAAEALFRSIGVPGGSAMVTSWRAGLIGLCALGAGFFFLGDRNSRRLSQPTS